MVVCTFSLKQQVITLFIIKTQLTCSVPAPAKDSSGQGESKAVVSPSSYLCQRNACQGLEGMWEQLARLSFTQTELTTGVLAPGKQLAI